MITVVVLSWCFTLTMRAGVDRIWLEARINGRDCRLVFDSGSNVSALRPEEARRLGLGVSLQKREGSDPPSIAGETEECELLIEGSAVKTKF
jgi:Aspartyl protease